MQPRRIKRNRRKLRPLTKKQEGHIRAIHEACRVVMRREAEQHARKIAERMRPEDEQLEKE